MLQGGGNNRVIISHSNVQEGQNGISNYNLNENEIFWLEGNLNIDPSFIEPSNGNFNLQNNSSCIDSGTSSFAWGGETIINLSPGDYNGLAPDMGANESDYSSECFTFGDINNDNIINVLDVVTLINIILGSEETNTCGDINSDGIYNVLDVVLLLNIILDN